MHFYRRIFRSKRPGPADVMRLWNAASAELSAGRFTKAVQQWSEAMQLQAECAQKAGLPRGIRFLQGISWTAGFGHIALLDGIAKARLLQMQWKHHVVLADSGTIANHAYLDCLSQWIHVNRDGHVQHCDLNLMSDYPAVLEIDGEWRWLHDAMHIVERRWQAGGRTPLLHLTQAQIERGWVNLEDWGIPRDSWFVALHIRESGMVSGSTAMDSLRNAQFSSYHKAIKRIVDAGGHVIHIGQNTRTPDGSFDVFLLSQARFMIGTNSGPVWVAGSFGTPVLLTNWAPIGIKYHYPLAICMPKRLWSQKKRRMLTDEEHNKEPYAFLESESAMAEYGLGQVPNTPDEIADGVDRMLITFRNRPQAASN
jgi:putative glycosyltransferase (TIGR04372 family)